MRSFAFVLPCVACMLRLRPGDLLELVAFIWAFHVRCEATLAPETPGTPPAATSVLRLEHPPTSAQNLNVTFRLGPLKRSVCMS